MSQDIDCLIRSDPAVQRGDRREAGVAMCCYMLYNVLMTDCLSIYSRAALPPLVTAVTAHERALTHVG